MRYCAVGHLEAIKVDFEHGERYLITRESVDRRIKEIQQIDASRHVAPRRDVTGHGAPQRDSGELPTEGSDRLKAQAKALESEILDLKIANRAKGQYIEQLQSDRTTLVQQISSQSRQIGQLETRLELQAGPSPDRLPEASSPEERRSPTVEGPDDSGHSPSDGHAEGERRGPSPNTL